MNAYSHAWRVAEHKRKVYNPKTGTYTFVTVKAHTKGK